MFTIFEMFLAVFAPDVMKIIGMIESVTVIILRMIGIDISEE